MSTELAVARPLVKASTELSQSLGMEVPMMIDAMKSQCFKGKRPDEVTDAQLATYISTANALKLNPLLPSQMYAYPDRQGGGITVMLGPDGVFTLLSNHPDVVAQKDGGPAFWTEHGKDGDKDTCTGYINHRTKGLLKKTIWVDEWIVSSNPNWQTRRHHMSEIRALKQVGRMVIHGLPVDSDEHALGEMLNVTPAGESTPSPDKAPDRPPPPARLKKGASAVQDASPKPEAKGTTMEAEIVPPTAKTTVTTLPPTQEPAAQEPPKEKPVTPAPGAGNPKLPRSSIKDGEELTMVCTIDKVYTMIIKSAGVLTPSVQANVLGDFVGSVIHIGGATQPSPDADLVANPEWKIGSTVTLHLLGKANTTGKVVAAVQKIIPQEATPESQAMEMD